MSRTFAKLELSVSKNGNTIKTFSQDISSENGSDRDLSTLLGAMQKTKESSNQFLTTLVEQDKLNGFSGGAVTSHSKRKHIDDDENDSKRLTTGSDMDDE